MNEPSRTVSKVVERTASWLARDLTVDFLREIAIRRLDETSSDPGKRFP